jgi:hypothetical protein
MNKLDRKMLKLIILQEIQKMKEDALYVKHKQGHDFRKSSHSHSSQCMECGYKMRENDSVCEQCGAMYEIAESLNEGDCGCPDDCDCRKNKRSVSYMPGDYEVLDYDTDNDFIPDHMEHDYEDDILSPGEALGVGISIGQHSDDVKIGNHGHYKGAYMAKKQMYKVAKYAEKLYQMIPDGHNLEDWMRTKLAQISDDISEVYHALDHDIFEGDV